MIPIKLNGATTRIPALTCVRDLLVTLDIDPEVGGIAVAINAAVVPRSRWPEVHIQPDDDVEIVRATAGG